MLTWISLTTRPVRCIPAARSSVAFPSADYAPATVSVIINIGGNKYRVTTAVNFDRHRLTIDFILDA